MTGVTIAGCLALLVVVVKGDAAPNKTEAETHTRDSKALSVFNVVTFPNVACGASTGYNGTCYTASECTSKGGTASGSCASSFGVCCVFNLPCGGSTTQNNTYAIIASYSTSSDKDPCAYTICKQNTDVCKLRIDFDTLVLAGPYAATPVAVADETKWGDCSTDTLTVTNPGGPSPPIICGLNTGQHMYVPASDACNTINIDVDSGTTTTTRKWQIKVTQYECGNQMAPEYDCLQYFTAQTGTIATFNWDTSTTTVASTQVHLSHQYYDICFRRQRGYCSLCLSPEIAPASSTKTASSYGLGSSSDADTSKSAVGDKCTGLTTEPAAGGFGDYIEIANLQPGTGTSGTLGVNRMCGAVWDATSSSDKDEIATACTFTTPFRIGVHLDQGEVLAVDPGASDKLDKVENLDTTKLAKNEGLGYTGFYMAYWMNACT